MRSRSWSFKNGSTLLTNSASDRCTVAAIVSMMSLLRSLEAVKASSWARPALWAFRPLGTLRSLDYVNKGYLSL